MAGSRKNSKSKPNGPPSTGAVAGAARPTRVTKNPTVRRAPVRGNQAASTNQAPTNQAPTNQAATATQAPTNQAASTNQAQAPAAAPRRRGVLSADVLAHDNLFGLPDPDALLRNRRAPRPARTSGTRPVKRATKPKRNGTQRPAAAAPAPVAQPTQPALQPAPQPAEQQPPQPATQPAQQSPPDNVAPQAIDEPANKEPTPADDAVVNDLTAEEQAEIEAAKVQEDLLRASAARDRLEKEEAANKKKREAAEKEEAAKRKEAREKTERDEAARVEQEEADRKVAAEKEAAKKEAAKKEAAEKLKAAQKQKDAEEEAARQKAAEKEATDKAEAERQRQAQEQAERDLEAARIAKEEAVRKQAAEEAARQQEAREKAAADAQKAAEEKKLAEEKQAAEERKAAQSKADQERLSQEKAAADAKAAQDKEQAAVKAKAAQDEAAKIKAAAQKKADDDVAAFKKAEEEAKLEKVRQAKEQKEKEAKELEEKELRGLKRPGVKRAAPQTDDQANKKAKTDDCKPSCTDFEKGLTFAKFKFGDSRSPKTPEGPIKFGSHLNLDTIFQALASVTEAINDACVRDSQSKIWGLFHPRSLVDFDMVDHPVVLHRHEALVPIQRRAGKKTHFSLIALVQTEVASRYGRDYFAIHHYDCDPSLRSAFVNTIAKTTVRSQILAAGWAGSNKGDIETPLGKSENADCCDRLPGAEQEWTTGIHAVLNGWVCALKLKHNKNALLSKEGFYEKAVDLINLAIRKHIASKTILNFFDCYEYVLKDDLPEEDRQLRTFSETKNFETYARLDKYILGLLGRKPRIDVDEITGTGPRTERTPVTEKPLGSGRPTGDHAPSNLDAFLKGADGPAGIPKDEKETDDAEEPKQGPVEDDGYDSARSNNDEDEIDNIDEEGNTVIEEEIVVEEPKQLFDWRGKAITEETRKAQAAARAAAKEKLAQAKREREEKEAAEAAARAKAAEPDDTDKSLFGEDDDEDMGDFYNNNDEPPPNDQTAPTSAPQHENAQEDSDEDLYGSSRPPQRQAQTQPALQPTVVEEDEEDLYTASPPRNRNPPPAAASAFNLNLNLPRPPPPTPHDPYTANGNPFLFPTMYDHVPPPPTKPSFNLVVENGPILPPPVPPPTSSNTVPASTQIPRQFANPNPHGTFTVPDLPSDSDENYDDNVPGQQNGTVQPKLAHPKPTITTKPKPAAAKPTEPSLDEEAAWEAAGFTRRAQSPSLEAAMAEYDDDNNNADDDNQLEDPNEYLPDEPTRDDHDGVEPTQIQSGDDDELEPDPQVVVRHGVGDHVQYGNVQVEVEEGEKVEDHGGSGDERGDDEIDYYYGVDEDMEPWEKKEKERVNEDDDDEEDEIDYDDVDD